MGAGGEAARLAFDQAPHRRRADAARASLDAVMVGLSINATYVIIVDLMKLHARDSSLAASSTMSASRMTAAPAGHDRARRERRQTVRRCEAH